MVAENEDKWSIPLLFPTKPDECEICGKLHRLEKCSFLDCPLEHVKDTHTPSYAHLTLPDGLKVKELLDGVKIVVATKPFRKGIQFGPFIAKTSRLMDLRIDFPLKVFLNDEDSVYLESYEELFCNWMCLVPPASNYQEQNLICYQYKTSIYFCTLREIGEGQELRVWYAPYYAEKMGVQTFARPPELVNSSDEEFQEIYASLQNGAHIQDHTYMPKLKKIRRRRLPKKPVLGENYYRAIPPNDVLPGELLGAKERRGEWLCKECGVVENNVAAYARHLMVHYRHPMSKLFYCPYCPKWFKKDGQNRQNHIDHCKEEHGKEKPVQVSSDKPKQSDEFSENVPENNTSVPSQEIMLTEEITKTLKYANLDNYILLEKIPSVNIGSNILWNDNNSGSSFGKKLDTRDDNQSTDQNKSIITEENTSRTISKSRIDSQFHEKHEISGEKEAHNLQSETITEKYDWNTVNEMHKTTTVEMIKTSCSNVGEKNDWSKDNKLFESEGNSIGLDSHMNPPILDLSDDIDFHMTKSFAEIISDHCNLEKTSLFSKSSRGLDLFDVSGPNLLASEITLPLNSSLDTTSFNPLGKSGFLQCSFTSCDDVTDEERNRIVENLLSETDEKFLVNDYEITDGCVSENPDSEYNIENSTENEKKSGKEKRKPKSGGDFTCDICRKSFSKQLYLYRHLRKHTGEFRCNICYMVFARKETLQTHRLTCPAEATTQQSITRIRVHCSFCKQQFHSLSSLQNHLEVHYCRGDNWKCACGKTSNDFTLIENHSCPNSNVSISCLECSEVFTSAENFTDHKNRLNRRSRKRKDLSLVCDICGLRFKTQTGARLHRNTHGEKRYECPVCGKKYCRNDTMMEHRTTHGPPLECAVCKKLFPSQKSYRNHYRVMHSNIHFTCQYCDKQFHQKGNLIKHLKTHRPDTEYVCKECGTKFATKQNYKIHLKSHTGGVIFQCTFCDKVFNVKYQLKTHIRRQHSEMYKCAYCSMDIRYRHTLKKHLSSKHRDVADEWNKPDAIKAMMCSQSEKKDSQSLDENIGANIISNSSVKDILKTAADAVLEDESLLLDNNDSGLVANIEDTIVNYPFNLPEGYRISENNDSAEKQLAECSTILINVEDIQCVGGDDEDIPKKKHNIQASIVRTNVKQTVNHSEITKENTSLQLLTLNIGSVSGNNDDPVLDNNVTGGVLNLPLAVISDFQLENQTDDSGLVANIDNAIVNYPFALPEEYNLSENEINNSTEKELAEDGTTLINVEDIQCVEGGRNAYLLQDGSVVQQSLPLENNVIFYVINTSNTLL